MWNWNQVRYLRHLQLATCSWTLNNTNSFKWAERLVKSRALRLTTTGSLLVYWNDDHHGTWRLKIVESRYECIWKLRSKAELIEDFEWIRYWKLHEAGTCVFMFDLDQSQTRALTWPLVAYLELSTIANVLTAIYSRVRRSRALHCIIQRPNMLSIGARPRQSDSAILWWGTEDIDCYPGCKSAWMSVKVAY